MAATNHSELSYEKKRLAQTIALANKQLKQARELNEENKEAIISAKQDLRENTMHSIPSLSSSEGFEALAELNQYMNPIADKIADYEEVKIKILQLEKLIQSPYFARIDFTFEDEDQPEEIYIGRSSLMKEDKCGIDVYDWRSPVASVFYRFVMGKAFYEAPGGRIDGELHLKRHFEISKGKLEYFFDSEIQIIDEFLRKLLSRNTSPKMKTIVETIQQEQDIVIRDMENDLMMVQGVAGSGKTSIALHRAAYLMYQDLSARLSAENIMIISPNTLFEQYISDVLPELGEDQVLSTVFDDLLKKVLPNKRIQSRNQFLENLISGPGDQNIVKSSIAFKTSPRFCEILDRFIEELPHKWIPFADVVYQEQRVVRKEVLKERVLSLGDEMPLGIKLKLIEDYILESIRDVKKKRVKKSEELQIKEKINRFTELNIEELYKQFIGDKEYFYSLTEGIELPDDIEDIRIFTLENLCGRQLYYDDAAVLAYLQLKINRPSVYKSIRQVVVDEAQDYYPAHFEIFHLLFPNAKFTILGDINQTLEKREDSLFYEQIRQIFHKKHSSHVTLDKSFRCTTEILEYSLKFLEKNPAINSFNRSGKEPQIFHAKDQEHLNAMILAEIKSCRKEGYQSIGLICKTAKNARYLFDCLKDDGQVQLIKEESAADLHGICIMPVYMSKGLEFDAVLICDADDSNYYSEDDKKLLYISCTRALHRLNMFCKGKISTLL